MNKVSEGKKEVECSVFLSCSNDDDVCRHLYIADTSELAKIVDDAKKNGFDGLTLVKTETTRDYYSF